MEERMRLLLLGDSVTVGDGFSGVTARTRYVSHLRSRLGPSHLELIDSALEGIDSGYALKRFNRMVTAFDPDAVLVLLGLNDARPPGARLAATPEQFRQNMLGLVDRILAIEARPILASPNPRFSIDAGEDTPELMRPYADAVRDVAEHYQVGWIDLYERFLQQGDLLRLVPDGIHPGPAGHELIAEVLSESLAPLFGGPVAQADSAPEDLALRN